MSRSYKKSPINRMALWGKSMKKGKQYANRKIRRKLRHINVDIGNGKHYKSLGIDSWDLWEFKFYKTKEEAICNWERDQKELLYGIDNWGIRDDCSLEEQINDWEKFYKRK